LVLRASLVVYIRIDVYIYIYIYIYIYQFCEIGQVMFYTNVGQTPPVKTTLRCLTESQSKLALTQSGDGAYIEEEINTTPVARDRLL